MAHGHGGASHETVPREGCSGTGLVRQTPAPGDIIKVSFLDDASGEERVGLATVLDPKREGDPR